jgi:hypothetical protein
MSNPELDAHTTEQDRLDDLEEARLLPIYAAQRDVLEGFAQWLNDQHPSESPYQVMPKVLRGYEDYKPHIDGRKSAIECVGETTEIDPDGSMDEDALAILLNLYQKTT